CMSCKPSVQPLITPRRGKLAGSPRTPALPHIFPSVVQPVSCTRTMPCSSGLSPVPGWRTFDAMPDAVRSASAGGAATSAGGGTFMGVSVGLRVSELTEAVVVPAESSDVAGDLLDEVHPAAIARTSNAMPDIRENVD